VLQQLNIKTKILQLRLIIGSIFLYFQIVLTLAVQEL